MGLHRIDWPFKKLCFVAALISLVSLPLLFTGDMPWINDEPLWIDQAINCQRDGLCPTHGPQSTLGVAHHGPLPIWMYATLLFFTNDLIVLARWHTFVVLLLTFGSLFWFLREIGKPFVWGIFLAALSPYLYFFHRLLWDNTIPFAILTAASYLSFCKRPTVWKAATVAFGVSAMFMTHLMSVSFILPLILHALSYHRRWIRDHVIPCTVISLTTLAALWPYLQSIRFPSFFSSSAKLAVRNGMDLTTFSDSIRYLFFGGIFFSGFDMEYFFGGNWFTSDSLPWLSVVLLLARSFTLLAIPATWIGMGMACIIVYRGLSHPRTEKGVLFHCSLLALLTLLFFGGLTVATRVYSHPHYYNAVWWVFLFFLILGVNAIPLRRLRQSLISLHIGALGLILFFFITKVHLASGNQWIHYGPSLSEQIRVVRELQQFHPESPIIITVPNVLLFPHALETIAKFYSLHRDATGERVPLVLRPRGSWKEGWLTLTQESDPSPVENE